VPTPPLNDVVLRLRRAALPAEAPPPTDGQLLECFVARRDEAAFAELVRRHGPMVLGVCRRVLGHQQDAEDAFQATFLVLARKAAAVRPRDLVGNFLYGVACNTARKARGVGLRRRAREQEAAAMPRPEPAEEAWHDLEPLLDQELLALPDRYRAPLVLCDLEGLTRKEAARRLGCAEGTVASRLARGRGLLGRRLRRHLPALSAAAVAAALARGAAAAVSGAAVRELVGAAGRFAAGQAAAGGAVSARAVALAEGVLKAMMLSKLKTAAALLLALAFVVGGVAWYGRPARAQSSQPVTTAPEAPATDPRTKPPAREEASTAPQPNERDGAALTLRHARLEQVNAETGRITVVLAGGTTGTTHTAPGPGTGGTTTGTGTGASAGLPSGGTATRLVDLPVAKDAKILTDDRLRTLAGLKPGAQVTLRLTAEEDRLVVVGITVEGGKAAERPDEERERQAKRKALEARAEAARADLLAARATVEVRQANIKRAEVILVQLQNAKAAAADVQKAKVDLEVAVAELKQAEAVAAVAEFRLKEAESELRAAPQDKNPPQAVR